MLPNKALKPLPSIAGTLTCGLTHFVRILAHMLAPLSLKLYIFGNDMQTWKLNNLENKFSSNPNACELIRSISNSIDIFRYHFVLARDENAKIKFNDPIGGFELVFPPENKAHDLEVMKLTIQANVQACIHATRPIYDIFGQLVNELVIDKPIPVYKCTIHSVIDRLPQSELKNCLTTLTNSDSFEYMNAFVNTIKHRNLVNYGTLVDLEKGESGVQFKAFTFNKKSYSAMWAKDVLELILDVKNGIVTAGIALNSHLGVKNV